MTQKDKELLAKDIFARVLTETKVDYEGEVYTLGYNLYLKDGNVAFESYPIKFYLDKVEKIKPYLRPMSSMTEEEKKEYIVLDDLVTVDGVLVSSCSTFDWLNAHHFDYRGLIKKGFALEAPEGMYKIK